MTQLSEEKAQEYRAQLERAMYELKKVIVGQEHLLERLLLAVITQGHVLVEGAPGLAKTLTLKSLAQVLCVEFKRIQFTPDLLPADLIGTRIYNPGQGSFSTEMGPIFTHFLLADEINRAPAKVQSALLEAMQESQVTIGRETFPLKAPFLVMATQNPIESEGTYPLPEAQLDRFLFKIVIDYPDAREENTIIERMTGDKHIELDAIFSEEQLNQLMQDIRTGIFMDPKISHYIVDIIQATRSPESEELKGYIQYGASPRGSLALANASRAMAVMKGRNYVIPEDVEGLVRDCLRHRIILSYEGLAAGHTTDSVLEQIQEALPAPVLTGV